MKTANERQRLLRIDAIFCPLPRAKYGAMKTANERQRLLRIDASGAPLKAIVTTPYVFHTSFRLINTCSLLLLVLHRRNELLLLLMPAIRSFPRANRRRNDDNKRAPTQYF